MERQGQDPGFAPTARRVSYDTWRGVNRLGEDLLVWNYRITQDQIPGWRLHHAQSIDAPGWPRSVQSAWSRPKGGDALFDVFECASRIEAHALLVRLLANVQSARLEHQPEPSVGDVMFGRGRAPVRIFARGNIVFFLRAADREPTPIAQTAGRLDKQLISKPARPRGRELPVIERFSAEAEVLQPGETVALDIRAADPAEESLWYKCFTPSGELWLSQGRPVYRHTTDGPARVNLYAVAPGRGAAHRRLELSSARPDG